MRFFALITALILLIQGISAQETPLYKDNTKAVLYFGLKAPKLDGDPSDWSGLAGTSPGLFVYGAPRGPGNPSAVIRLRTDNKKLYILAEVTDLTAKENEYPAPLAWRSDSVELYIGTETGHHERYATGDNQIRLVPRSRSNSKALGVSVNDRIVDTERDVQGAVVYTEKGYIIEAALPFRLLKLKPFAVGQAIRADFQINDAGTGERDILTHWHAPKDDPYWNPSSWGDGVVEALPEGL